VIANIASIARSLNPVSNFSRNLNLLSIFSQDHQQSWWLAQAL
jgi:hypothetical protein